MTEARTVGRYELHGVFASGGMARVHYGRLEGAAGFRRVVAIKRLHPAYARDPAFRAMLIDEARLVASVRHANVAAVLDVIDEDEELSLVLEYIAGESLSRLASESRERGVPIPPAIAVSVAVGILRGLHAAHEATEASGAPLGLVHRDVSPHNVVVGVDGVCRVLDFGVAKALGRAQSTSHGEVKGKAAYMAPEQVRGDPVDRRADVFAAGIVVWELLSGRRLFEADSGAASMMRILDLSAESPSRLSPGIPPEIDEVVLRALARDKQERWVTAASMADALEAALRPAPAAQVSAWVQELAGSTVRQRAEQVRQIEAAPPLSSSTVLVLPEPTELAERDASASALHPLTRRRHPATVLVPLAIVALLIGVFVVRAGTGSASDAARDAPSAAPSSASSASSAPSVASADPSADPRAEPSSEPSPPGSASTVVVNPPPEPSPRPHPGKPAARPRPGKSTRCTPPYTVGPNGFHQIKPECL